jgi:hypothetical protein
MTGVINVRIIPLILAAVMLLSSCTSYSTYRGVRAKSYVGGGPTSTFKSIVAKPVGPSLVNEQGATVAERIKVPAGFERTKADEKSFGNYLRNFPLNPSGSKVKYYNGDVKSAEVYVAVFNMDIGGRDLQQCADAIMRLRAEYLYQKGQYDGIHFNFTNGFRADYAKWRAGNRIVIDGNKASWVQKNIKSTDYKSFREYLDMVFAYAGTLSLSKEMKKVTVAEMQIGDVFIEGGSPGHAVIVVDMAENKETGEKLFLLAQSYMPAQDIQLLKNPKNDDGNPWYSLGPAEDLNTPEWSFTSDRLMRFE